MGMKNFVFPRGIGICEETAKFSEKPMSSPIADEVAELERCIRERPSNLEPILTEMYYLIKKFDPSCTVLRKPVRSDFEPEKFLKQIRDRSGMPDMTIPQIRFKADELSKAKRIPLPNSTRKHKEPLLQWFSIHWNEIAHDISQWKSQAIPNAD
jgi:hypothetical protein